MDAAGLPHAMTLEQWAELDEDVEGELEDGYLVEEEMPTYIHETVVVWLIGELRTYLRGRGAVFGSEAKLGISQHRGRKPDVSAYLPGTRRPPGRASMDTRPPSIVVEVLTARPRDVRRDRKEKYDDYAAFGVPWYWLIDPATRLVEIFRLGADGRYVRELAAAEGTLDVPGCEGLRLDLDDLWREVDAAQAVPCDDDATE